MLQKVISAAIDRFSGNDMIAGLSQVLDGVGMVAAPEETARAATPPSKGSDPLFKYILGRVGQTTIDVASVSQIKSCRSMLRVFEHIGGSLINRYCPGVAGRIGGFLSNVELFGFKFPFSFFAHVHYHTFYP